MRRYWIDEGALSGDRVELTGDTFHHIVRVCRQEKGSRFEVLTLGQAHLIELVEVRGKTAEGRVLERRNLTPLPRPYIHLCLSMPRFPTMDTVVEKSVELGVRTVRPFLSEFSFVRKKDSVPPAKVDRWEKIVVSATQQSGRGDLMKIQPTARLEELLEEFNRQDAAVGLFPYEGASELSLKSALTLARGGPIENIWVFVGSEGGFSRQEVDLFADRAGLKPVSLGSQVLRVETACVALISVLKYEFDLA